MRLPCFLGRGPVKDVVPVNAQTRSIELPRWVTKWRTGLALLEALHPARSPLCSLKGWCEVGDLGPDPAITKMEDIDGVPYAPVGVADPGLGDVVVAGTGDLEDSPAGRCHPPVLAACDPVGLNVRQTGRVVIVHLAVARYAANAFSRLGHFPHVVRVQELCQGVPIPSIHFPPIVVDRLAVALGRHGGHGTSLSSISRADAAATQ